jgi:YbgC/YbaW family acyl-CoA thioester hydrolase
VTRQISLALATYLPRKAVPGQTIVDPSITRTRVRPGDLDIYLHVNNAVYLNMMDTARSNLLADCGGMRMLNVKGWYPVVAASTVKYKRSLVLWDPVVVTTRVLGWDPRIAYLEQTITVRGELSARGIVAGRFLGKGGVRVPAPDVVELLGGPETSPELPDDVMTWARAVDVAHR